MIKLFFFGDIEVGCSQNSSIYTCFDEKKIHLQEQMPEKPIDNQWS